MAKKEPEVKLLRRQNKMKAAYTLVDLSDLHPELRKDIIEDAHEGGGTYGIRVVEESVNGPARAPIYGYYNEGPDADRWASAKKELGLDGTEVPDDEVYSGAGGVEITDPARAAALRQQAVEQANAEAESIRTAEDRDIAAITGDGDDEGPRVERVPSLSHRANIVDDTLDPNATNEAGEAQNRTLEESKSGSDAEGESKTTRRSSNKAPK